MESLARVYNDLEAYIEECDELGMHESVISINVASKIMELAETVLCIGFIKFSDEPVNDCNRLIDNGNHIDVRTVPGILRDLDKRFLHINKG